MTVYDLAAPAYNAVSRLLPFERGLREAAGAALAGAEEIVDLGCGTGFQLGHLPRSVRRVVGIDSSARSLEVAGRVAARRGLELTAIAADAATVRLPPGSVDGAIAVFALSVIPNWEQALEHCVRAVRPGGRIVVLEQERVAEGPLRLFNPLTAVANRFLGADSSRNYRVALETLGCRVDRQQALGGMYALYVAVT